jgi:glutathione S-transferase
MIDGGPDRMDGVTLHGPAYSAYVRIARLALEEIGVPYDLVEVDIFDRDSWPADYGERHPFGKVPAFEHDGFRLFETDAIVSYVVDEFDGRRLYPDRPRERARAVQIMRVMDSYAYPRLVWGVFVEETEKGRAGQLTGEEVERARHTLAVVDRLASGPFLAGHRLCLADLWALPMLTYLRLAPSGPALLAEVPALSAWLDRMSLRPSAVATRFPREQLAADSTES